MMPSEETEISRVFLLLFFLFWNTFFFILINQEENMTIRDGNQRLRLMKQLLREDDNVSSVLTFITILYN